MLERLLRERHAKDIYVDECHMAESGSQRLDGWALLRTWSPLTTIGYEVKRSRSDFARDNKWPSYLKVCHLFFWVCPPKLIAIDEVPEGCGLLYQAGSRLMMKKKAPRHEPDPHTLIRLMSYVLMSRTQIVANMWRANDKPNVDLWRGLLLEQEGEKIVGHMVSRRLRFEVQSLRGRVVDAERKSRSFENLENRLREIGVDPSEPGAFDKAYEKTRDERAVSELDGLRKFVLRVSAQLTRMAEGKSLY
jgi:hypothetical protein